MKEIYVINAPQKVLISDEDYEKLKPFVLRFSSPGYVFLCYKNKKTLLHRFILNLKRGDSIVVDHKDGNTCNNTRENLRCCKQYQNAQNRKLKPGKFKGVRWKASNLAYVVRIKDKEKEIYLGSFKDKLKCARIYNAAAKILFGEFALLNVVNEPTKEEIEIAQYQIKRQI